MNSCSLDHILSLPLIVFSGSQSVRRSALAAHPRLSAIITVSHSQARRTRRFCRAKRPRFTRAEGPCLLRHKASSLCAGTLALCTGASDRIATSCGRNPSFGSSLFGSPRSRCKHDTSPASSRKPSQLSLRLRTLPFPGLSKIITACAAACPLSTSYPSVRRSPTAVQTSKDRSCQPIVMGLTRLELVTPSLSEKCSNRLSYRPKKRYRKGTRPEGLASDRFPGQRGMRSFELRQTPIRSTTGGRRWTRRQPFEPQLRPA